MPIAEYAAAAGYAYGWVISSSSARAALSCGGSFRPLRKVLAAMRGIAAAHRRRAEARAARYPRVSCRPATRPKPPQPSCALRATAHRPTRRYRCSLLLATPLLTGLLPSLLSRVKRRVEDSLRVRIPSSQRGSCASWHATPRIDTCVSLTPSALTHFAACDVFSVNRRLRSNRLGALPLRRMRRCHRRRIHAHREGRATCYGWRP